MRIRTKNSTVPILCRIVRIRMKAMKLNIEDNGGRRKNTDRRRFTYTFHIPERRNGADRRSGKDRRSEDRLTSVQP